MQSDPAAVACNQQAIQLAQQGQIDAAIQCFLRGLQAAPDQVLLINNLAGLLCQIGRFHHAALAARRAIAAWPNVPEGHNHLGNALIGLRDYPAAIAAFQAALALRPDFADAHNNLGRAFRESAQIPAAIGHYLQAVRLRPDSPQYLHNLAEAYCQNSQFEQAIEVCQKALVLIPNDPYALDLLATAHRSSGDLARAVQLHQRALELMPDNAMFHNNLGIALQLSGQLGDALTHFRRAVALAPEFPQAHFNLGLTLLTQGDLTAGWPEYEWRLANVQPPWDGGDLGGKTIVLHAEQGLGDAIQFVRYLPIVAARNGRIILVCRRELHRLFRSVAAIEQLIAPGQPIPRHDLQCPLMSLPRIFQTMLADIPSQPYLFADAALAAQWKSRLPQDARLKVGFLAANRATPPDRCPPASAYGVLADVANICLINLQKDKTLPLPDLQFIDFTLDLIDFADTAALMANLDLVVTVDTAVAHLAGALGRPVWLLLRFLPDWRWFLNRPDSPWYPSMRLYRQPALGDWQTPIAHIRRDLVSRAGPIMI